MQKGPWLSLEQCDFEVAGTWQRGFDKRAGGGAALGTGRLGPEPRPRLCAKGSQNIPALPGRCPGGAEPLQSYTWGPRAASDPRDGGAGLPCPRSLLYPHPARQGRVSPGTRGGQLVTRGGTTGWGQPGAERRVGIGHPCTEASWRRPSPTPAQQPEGLEPGRAPTPETVMVALHLRRRPDSGAGGAAPPSPASVRQPGRSSS